MEIEAINRAGAAVGQKVRVMVHTYAYLEGSMIVYGVPALFLVIGAVFGRELMPGLFPGFDTDTLSAIFGFSFLGISFILVKLWAWKKEKKSVSTPVIEEIIS